MQPLKMENRRSLIDDRRIEFDALAIVMLGLGFLLTSTVSAVLVSNASGHLDLSAMIAGAGVGAAVIVAWIFGYPRHATAPSISLALMAALIVIPRVIHLGNALLPEADALPAVHRVMIGGLYAGGLMLALIAFMVCGFIGPTVGAYLRTKRREDGAREGLVLHAGLFGAACALVAVAAILP